VTGRGTTLFAIDGGEGHRYAGWFIDAAPPCAREAEFQHRTTRLGYGIDPVGSAHGRTDELS
jgi:hypothetical protein